MSVAELIEALTDAGYEPRAYSGRGMGGAQCVAVDPDEVPGGVFGVGCRLGADFVDLRPSQDSMGQGQILYFRSAAWPT